MATPQPHLTSDRAVPPSIAPDLEPFARSLLESDRLYFEAAAQICTYPGGSIAAMPNLAHIAAGCVAHRIIAEDIAEPQQWLAELETRLKHFGCTAPRIYLDNDAPALETALKSRGYLPQVEVGLLDTALLRQNLSEIPSISLRPVLTEQDWQQKIYLHRAVQVGPDGHVTDAEEWVSLERRKCEAGSLRVYLVCRDGEVCGTVGAMEVGDLLRLKNLVIHPEWRRHGIGQAAVEALRREAVCLEKVAFGCFALLNGAGQRLYERAGLTIATQQVEWYKPQF